MKKCMLRIFFVGMMIFSLSSPSRAESIRMGYFEIKPHMYPDSTSGKPAGASARYFETVAKEMGYEVQWEGPLPFPRLVSYLQEGRVDGSLLIYKNPEREKFLFYPEKPYLLAHKIFVVRKDNPLEKIESVENVKGYRVGFLQGANLAGFIKDHLNSFEMDYIAGQDWVKNNLLKLIHGRIDAVYDLNETTMLFEAKKMKIEDQIKILPLPETPGEIFVVFSKKSANGQSLTDKYQKAAESLALNYQDFLDTEFRMEE